MAYSSGYGSISTATADDSVVSNSRFANMSDTVGTNIFTINTGSTTLERILKQIGTPRDKLGLRDSIHLTQQKTNGIILSTTQMIRDLSNLARRGDKQQRLRAERLRNEFQDSVQRYTSLQKQMAEKIRMSYGYKSTYFASSDDDGMSGTNEKTGLLEEELKETFEQQQVLKNIEFEQALLQEREQRIQQIEEDILDVNDIFRSLGAMVHDQGEVINTIEANVDKTYGNVEGGRSQLAQAAEYQKKYRQKLCCLMVVIMIVGIIVTLVILFSIKS